MSANAGLAWQFHHLISPLFWATFVSAALVGCSTAQAIAWGRRSARSDPIWIRAFVGSILAMSAVKCGCDLAGMYSIMVATQSGLARIPLAFHVAEVLSSFVVVLCQSWQFHRTLVVSRYNLFIICIGGVMLTVSLAGTLLFSIGFSNSTNIAQTAAMIHIWNPFSSWVKVSLDLFLSISFTAYVLRAQRNAIDHTLRHTLGRIARTALEAFVPCTILATGRAIAGYASPHSTLFAALLVVLAPTYCVSILHTLNSREPIRREACASESDEVELIGDRVRSPRMRG